ncbi:MAG: class I SAM-dependent methyltransferase, partial [Acidobacteriota bacterium]
MGILGSISHVITRLGRRIMGDNRLMVRGYFEHIYRHEDPYQTRVDPEGDQKRADIVRALEGRRFARGIELGSGEGTLALLYHDQVEKLTLTDISTRALARASERLAAQARERAGREAGDHSAQPAAARGAAAGRVTAQRLDFVADPLPGTFDLIVCQESLVYTRVADLPAVSDKIVAALEPGGTLVLLHPRSIHDDDSGLEYKDIGAKTVHQP